MRAIRPGGRTGLPAILLGGPDEARPPQTPRSLQPGLIRLGLLSRAVACAVALVAALAAAGVRALEPRYDHRDQQGVIVEPMLAYDVVAIPGHESHSSWRPGLRIAYSWDVLGQGNELLLGVQTAFSWSDPARDKIRLAFDARYRAYFGTEQWKTFFELGVWAPVASRLAIGPLVSIGVAYDLSRSGGVFVDGGFATGFGGARIASFTASAGAQLRF